MNKDSPPVFEPTPAEKAFVSEYINLIGDGLLIKKGTISIRMFSVNTGATVVAFIFGETTDSFMVGLPAMLIVTGEGISAKMVSPTPIVRMLKNSISMVAMPTQKYLFSYLSVCRNQMDKIPGYFDIERKTQVESLLTMMQNNLPPSETKPINLHKPNVNSSIKNVLKDLELSDFESPRVTSRKRRYNH